MYDDRAVSKSDVFIHAGVTALDRKSLTTFQFYRGQFEAEARNEAVQQLADSLVTVLQRLALPADFATEET